MSIGGAFFFPPIENGNNHRAGGVINVSKHAPSLKHLIFQFDCMSQEIALACAKTLAILFLPELRH